MFFADIHVAAVGVCIEKTWWMKPTSVVIRLSQTPAASAAAARAAEATAATPAAESRFMCESQIPNSEF